MRLLLIFLLLIYHEKILGKYCDALQNSFAAFIRLFLDLEGLGDNGCVVDEASVNLAFQK